LSIQTIIPKVIMSIKLNKHSDEALAQQQSKRLKSGSLHGAHGYSDEASTPDKGEVKYTADEICTGRPLSSYGIGLIQILRGRRLTEPLHAYRTRLFRLDVRIPNSS